LMVLCGNVYPADNTPFLRWYIGVLDDRRRGK